MQPFASSSDFREALGVYISQFAGGNPGKEKLILASVNVVSYGGGVATKGFERARAGTPTNSIVNAHEAKELCEECIAILDKSSGGEREGFWDELPWEKLLAIAFSYLKKYMPWLPLPAMPDPPAPSPVKTM